MLYPSLHVQTIPLPAEAAFHSGKGAWNANDATYGDIDVPALHVTVHVLSFHEEFYSMQLSVFLFGDGVCVQI